MAHYFALQSPQPIRRRTFAQADRLADSMCKKLIDVDVRLIAVRSFGQDGFIYAVVSRHPLIPQAVVSKLRCDRRFAGYSISEESPSIDGPFRWNNEKEGRSAL
ncbi:MAG: hypothetical protein ABIR10_18440 [Dokdonella sp.]